MKSLKGLLLTGLFVLGLGFTACNDDKDSVQPNNLPQIVVPGGVVNIETNATKDLTFVIEAPNGISTTEFKTAGGEFIYADTEEIGSTSKKITGNYTAGDETGPGAVTLTVVDLEGETITESIGINIASTK